MQHIIPCEGVIAWLGAQILGVIDRGCQQRAIQTIQRQIAVFRRNEAGLLLQLPQSRAVGGIGGGMKQILHVFIDRDIFQRLPVAGKQTVQISGHLSNRPLVILMNLLAVGRGGAAIGKRRGPRDRKHGGQAKQQRQGQAQPHFPCFFRIADQDGLSQQTRLHRRRNGVDFANPPPHQQKRQSAIQPQPGGQQREAQRAGQELQRRMIVIHGGQNPLRLRKGFAAPAVAFR